MKASAIIITMLLLATVAMAENLLVNGEFDGGFAEDPPGWTVGWGPTDPGFGDFQQTADGKAFGYAMSSSLVGNSDWLETCYTLSQQITAPSSGFYLLRVQGEFRTDAGIFDGYGHVKLRILGAEAETTEEVWGREYWESPSSIIDVAEHVMLEADKAYEFEVYVKSHGTTCSICGECETAYSGSESRGAVWVDYIRIEWDDAIAVEPSSWSTVKSLY